MPNLITARARAGTQRPIRVGRTAAARRRPLDSVAGTAVVVEVPAGEDRREQHALARDYAGEQQAFHDGGRLEDPLPTPQPPAREAPSWAA